MLEGAALQSIDESHPFVAECDASEVAISATLNPGGQPVAFTSRTLQGSELHYPHVEKRGHSYHRSCTQVALFSGWLPFHTGNGSALCSLHVGQQASFCYTVKYRPGKNNVAPDSFTRAFLSSVSTSSLDDIHKALCQSGVTRMLHFVRSKNLPFSTEEVKRTCSICKICAEQKPQFIIQHLIHWSKQHSPWNDRVSTSKGPLLSASRNVYILTVSSFLLEIKSYLSQGGIVTSKTTLYDPIGNGQVERYNGIIWRAVCLVLKSSILPDSQWERVLPDVLHSIRSFLSTSTNTTSHERFFGFQRRSSFGTSIPTWLTTPGPVLLLDLSDQARMIRWLTKSS
ncbi:uncharacterized protein LOC121367584 [Gigantopelta aegis]|uniref:uncharacterized protein LOC121367584 n=1 Tax=Gigantopelta aegis TaxID=1735272 RepID=UPI001B888FDB|nr:uncharacterized protein LOC121367584 [Gigantopelta aegis]